MVYSKERKGYLNKYSIISISFTLILSKIIYIFGENKINPHFGLPYSSNGIVNHEVSKTISTNSDFLQVLIDRTCGEKGNFYSKNGSKFIQDGLKLFSLNEYNRLKLLRKLPKIYSGSNKGLMLKSFRGGEILGSPIRLRERIIKDEHNIPMIEDDLIIMSGEDIEKSKYLFSRVFNEIRYSVLLCGGGLISLLPVVRYMKLLSEFGEDVSSDPIILEGVSIFEKEKAEIRRRKAKIEAKYLTTLPYSDEIFTDRDVRSAGLLIGVSDSIEEEMDLVASGYQNLIIGGDDQNVIIGLNIRPKEEYFEKKRGIGLQLTQNYFVYNPIFDLGTPNALFIAYNDKSLSVGQTKKGYLGSKFGNRIPHQITRAETISSATIKRIKTNFENLDTKTTNEYSVDGSIEPESNDIRISGNETKPPISDQLNPESIVIGRKIRSNDKISAGSYDGIGKIISGPDLIKSELKPISGYPLNEGVNQMVNETINELENGNYFSELIDVKASKDYKEAYRRFPAYISQKKIIPLSDQAYLFWESIRFSNRVMEQKYSVKISNFPDKGVPSSKILPNKTPVTGSEITKSCYRLIRYFQKNEIPFIFRFAEKINGTKDYNVSFIDPVSPHNLPKYKEYAKILCNKILPEVFIFTVHKVFEVIISKREQKYFEEMENKKLELEVQEKELDALKKMRESVNSRIHITPYIVENPTERYLNGWRRSFGYNGISVYPQIKSSVLEKIYNIVKFGPEIIEKKKKNVSPNDVKSSVSKAIVKIIDEYFVFQNSNDIFLSKQMVEEFISKIISQLFHISFDKMIKNMPISPEIDFFLLENKRNTSEFIRSCNEYVNSIIKFNKNINIISNEKLIQDSSGGIEPKKSIKDNSYSLEKREMEQFENGYEKACNFISVILQPNLIEYSLSMGSKGSIPKKVERIKNSFIHQSLTDGISQIPTELGLNMFEKSIQDIYKRVCEQHGILHFLPDLENKFFEGYPMFNEMSKRTQIELTSDTINFSDIEGIISVVYESVVAPKDGNNRIEFFNENILANYIFENLKENNVSTPSEIKSLPSFPLTHKYPWSAFFYPGLIKWCENMIYSLADEGLLSNTTNSDTIDKNNIGEVINATCREETIFGIRNNIEYEADEILRKNFAYHLGISFVYWIYKIPLPKWIFFDNWESIYSLDPKITLSEEPEISLVTFILFKCIVDMEYPKLSTKAKEISSIKREISNKNKSNVVNKTAKFKINLWNNIPAKSIADGKISLGYFLFPNVIRRDILINLSPDDVLAFTGPHDINWVGADESEFIPMCMNSIEKLNEYLKLKNLNTKDEVSIWVSEDINSRELLCRDIAGRFFYPRLSTNCDKENIRGISVYEFPIERLRLRRSQWLAIQEVIRRRTERREDNITIETQTSLFISKYSYPSYVVDFQESDEQVQPGSFVKNCIAAFDTAILFPEGSPYRPKIMDNANEIIRDICNESRDLYYLSAVPMSWDEQQIEFNPMNMENKYLISRIALSQHNAILDQITEQNELGDHSIRISERFSSLFSTLMIKIGISDESSKFIEICIEYLWECIRKKLLFLGAGYDISNSGDLLENICKKSSFRYFVSEIPITIDEMSNILDKGGEVLEWQRVRYKTGQWKMMTRVFNSIASKYPGGYDSAISKTFKLPKYMQLANFNIEKEILTIEEDCIKSISYLINSHSCASNFIVIFGRATDFCTYVAQAFKKANT
ncbi:hypothetical protein HWI79_3044 [Cryptosporidium felis]|nr:hypothetical protein HWI79_3044 [Cryptosporidium felis]